MTTKITFINNTSDPYTFKVGDEMVAGLVNASASFEGQNWAIYDDRAEVYMEKPAAWGSRLPTSDDETYIVTLRPDKQFDFQWYTIAVPQQLPT